MTSALGSFDLGSRKLWHWTQRQNDALFSLTVSDSETRRDETLGMPPTAARGCAWVVSTTDAAAVPEGALVKCKGLGPWFLLHFLGPCLEYKCNENNVHVPSLTMCSARTLFSL